MNKPLWESWTVWGAVLLGLGRVLTGVATYGNGDPATGINAIIEGIGIALGGTGLRRAIRAQPPTA